MPKFLFIRENEMAFSMGIHGEPGVWNGDIKSAKELADEAVGEILDDIEIGSGDEVAVLINGLSASSIELYTQEVSEILDSKGVKVIEHL